MAAADSHILTLDKAAASPKAGEHTVYRLAASGEIPAFKRGATQRFQHFGQDGWIAASINNTKPTGRKCRNRC